jgi:hypothetical protein
MAVVWKMSKRVNSLESRSGLEFSKLYIGKDDTKTIRMMLQSII